MWDAVLADLPTMPKQYAAELKSDAIFGELIVVGRPDVPQRKTCKDAKRFRRRLGREMRDDRDASRLRFPTSRFRLYCPIPARSFFNSILGRLALGGRLEGQARRPPREYPSFRVVGGRRHSGDR